MECSFLTRERNKVPLRDMVGFCGKMACLGPLSSVLDRIEAPTGRSDRGAAQFVPALPSVVCPKRPSQPARYRPDSRDQKRVWARYWSKTDHSVRSNHDRTALLLRAHSILSGRGVGEAGAGRVLSCPSPAAAHSHPPHDRPAAIAPIRPKRAGLVVASQRPGSSYANHLRQPKPGTGSDRRRSRETPGGHMEARRRHVPVPRA